jgi:hypothetical protein
MYHQEPQLCDFMYVLMSNNQNCLKYFNYSGWVTVVFLFFAFHASALKGKVIHHIAQPVKGKLVSLLGSIDMVNNV